MLCCTAKLPSILEVPAELISILEGPLLTRYLGVLSLYSCVLVSFCPCLLVSWCPGVLVSLCPGGSVASWPCVLDARILRVEVEVEVEVEAKWK